MRRSSQGMMSLSYDAGGGSGRGLLACYVRAKPRPSKWDDAQRWLSSSRAPDDDRRRSSCADDRLLLPSASQKGRHSWSAADAAVPAAAGPGAREDGDAEAGAEGEAQTKRVDSVLAYGQQPRCLSLRDIGTEMTPTGSKEPSRANTPRATLAADPAPAPAPSTAGRASGTHASRRRPDGGSPTGHACKGADTEERGEAAAPPAVSPATAWDAAERAKHMARYRREEMKIQAWENRRRQKAELEMKMTEINFGLAEHHGANSPEHSTAPDNESGFGFAAQAKVERMKLRAREKRASKLASAQAAAKEKRAAAEAKLSRRAARVGDKADALRRTGHLPSSSSSGFSLKLPLMCS
ncbi:uncharacterized protein C2845_PM11G10360 [Panicum miliaceum]|uniref:Remorin C-terminal domain-containing protein n=1 Tax=Panicum miliaceum TaxID=4540 RepID=A0A3L6RVJ0_PANMI|nr:uncharacterized protein C2845_PM11G10360 [Panicum miliaceum]